MKRSRKIGFVASAALVAVIVASLLAGVSKVGATCGNVGVCWHNVTSVNPGAGNNILNGVYAVSSSNIWAVGYYLDANETNAQTLIENGVAGSSGGVTTYTWTQSTSTNPGTGNYLNGVGFARNDLNATDVWAVGYYTTTSATNTLIEKYHSSSWSTVSSPNPSSSSNVLNAVAGYKAAAYWAVGYSYSSTLGANVTLIEQWNGTSWSQVASPNHGSGLNNYLTSISAVDINHAWATGYYVDSSSNKHALLLEWNGSSWSDDTSQLPFATNGTSLAGVSMLDGTNAWLVGSNGSGELGFLHDSGGWTESDPPSGPQTGVDYIGASSAWSVGYHHSGCCYNVAASAYWDGSGWTAYTPEGAGFYSYYFFAVNGVSNTDTWAVGYSEGLYTDGTLIEHYH